jgi:polysaccharide deacetylase family protein (PEP-CTERM system associated)
MRVEPPDSRYGLFTVDVEDWYHPLVKDPRRWASLEDRIWPTTLALLEALEPAGHRGTFFVLGCVAERHPDLVRRILAGGHEVGCHGHDHLSLQWIDQERFRADLVQALDALRAAGAGEVVSFRAPYFSLNPSTAWALPILAEHGIRIDSSVFPLRTGYYGHAGAANHPGPMGPLFEFPITLPSFGGVRIPLTGGFYSRFFPTGWTVAGLENVRRAGAEPMFYIHPWELDPGQPRINVGRFLTFRHYVRLDSTRVTLDALLRRGRWRTLRESFAERHPDGVNESEPAPVGAGAGGPAGVHGEI